MVAITLRSVKGAPLTSTEVDTNFTNLKAAVETLETNPAEPVEISNVTASGATITIHLSDGSSYPVTIPLRATTPPTVVTEADATHTPALSEANSYFRCTNVAGCVVTIPDDADVAFDTGTELHYRQSAAGAVVIVGGTGLTLNVPDGYLAETAGLGGVVTVKKVAADTWDVFGLLAPEAVSA